VKCGLIVFRLLVSGAFPIMFLCSYMLMKQIGDHVRSTCLNVGQILLVTEILLGNNGRLSLLLDGAALFLDRN